MSEMSELGHIKFREALALGYGRQILSDYFGKISKQGT